MSLKVIFFSSLSKKDTSGSDTLSVVNKIKSGSLQLNQPNEMCLFGRREKDEDANGSDSLHKFPVWLVRLQNVTTIGVVIISIEIII
jgi:hypothetical protein